MCRYENTLSVLYCNSLLVPPPWPSERTPAPLSFGWVLSFGIWWLLFGRSHTPAPSPGTQQKHLHHNVVKMCFLINQIMLFIHVPVCVASRLPPDRPPAAVSTVWHWPWTPAAPPSAWRCSPLEPPAPPPSACWCWMNWEVRGRLLAY